MLNIINYRTSLYIVYYIYDIMEFFFEIFFVILVIGLFYYYLKPKLRYFFYGAIFFFVGLILQLPLRYFYIILERVVEIFSFTHIIYVFLSIVIFEVTKYLSLKKFIRTRSFKNALFFGIGWVSFASINLFTILFFQYIFNFLALDFDYSYLLNPNYSFLYFGFIFVLNLAVTVYVILAIVKRNLIYLFYAIMYSWIVNYGLMILSGKDKFWFALVIFLVSLFVIFYHHRIHYVNFCRIKKTKSSK